MQAPGQVQRGSGEGSGEGLGNFGAKISHVQHGSGEGSGEVLVQSQVKFNRVPERVPRRKSGRLRCRAKSNSTGFRRCKEFTEALMAVMTRTNRDV